MLVNDGNTQRLAAGGPERALDKWRDAAQFVSTRWEVFLEAGPESRACAFASYVAALDGEQAAALEIEGFLSSTAEAA
jgi:hypothetical protein